MQAAQLIYPLTEFITKFRRPTFTALVLQFDTYNDCLQAVCEPVFLQQHPPLG
jgi:hypothetical protein